MNLVLSHLTEKKFDLISLRLLPSPVSSHLMKKNPVLSHPIKKKSHLILVLTQDRTGPGQKILILAVSLSRAGKSSRASSITKSHAHVASMNDNSCGYSSFDMHLV